MHNLSGRTNLISVAEQIFYTPVRLIANRPHTPLPVATKVPLSMCPIRLSLPIFLILSIPFEIYSY